MGYKIVALLLVCCSFSAIAKPQIIAHRAGTGDAPENTLYAINKAIDNKADVIWITVQLSKDNVPVLYRPSELEALTNSKGRVSQYTADELTKIDAAYQYNLKNKTQITANIPSLSSVLSQYPNTQFYIDLKSPDAQPAVFSDALITAIGDAKNRIRIYSTNNDFLTVLPATLQKFESRDVTRNILANALTSQQCDINQQDKPRWHGFELRRKAEVVERFTLGEARSPVTLVWDKEAMDCFRAKGEAHIILFGVNTVEDYKLAKKLGADGVMVDSPAKFKNIK